MNKGFEFTSPTLDQLTPICVTPHKHNTYTPPMAHAWGGSDNM